MILRIFGILFVFLLVVGPISFTTVSTADNRPDIKPPTGSIQVYHHLKSPAENNVATLTLQGSISDESGISSAYIRVANGDDEIILIDLGETENFTVDIEIEASIGAEYSVELYAADGNSEADGGANSGLVDSTIIRIPNDMIGRKSAKLNL